VKKNNHYSSCCSDGSEAPEYTDTTPMEFLKVQSCVCMQVPQVLAAIRHVRNEMGIADWHTLA
jgi:hypothetical protein